MAFHKFQDALTIEDFRAGGAAAGDKAGKEMIAKCCPPGSTNPDTFSLNLVKATADACAQMRSRGSTEENIAAWVKAFDAAVKPHALHVVTILGMYRPT